MLLNSLIPQKDLDLATESEIKDIADYFDRGQIHIGQADYDIRYMRLAREYSTWSKDPSTKIGAIAISAINKIIISAGYNGFPRGIEDNYRLYIRELKYRYVVHAEMNLIYNACESGVSLKNSTVYVYGLFVCSSCVDALIQVGVSRIVICNTKNTQKWEDSFKLTMEKLEESNVEYHILSPESLDC